MEPELKKQSILEGKWNADKVFDFIDVALISTQEMLGSLTALDIALNKIKDVIDITSLAEELSTAIEAITRLQHGIGLELDETNEESLLLDFLDA